MYIVSKEVKFEAAHRLVEGYPGNCRFCHGHSYKAIITMKLREKASLNQYGFVKDFGEFKELKAWIDENWDHSTLVSHNDGAWLNWLCENNQRHFVFMGNPTAESISRILFEKASELLNDYCSEVIEVKINETCTSEAVYRPTVAEVAALLN